MGLDVEQRLALEGGGTLWLREDGLRVQLAAQRRDDGCGLYKVWLRGGGGGRLLLGTMIPEGGELRLTRTLSRRALEEAACWPAAGGSAVLSYPFVDQAASGWVWEQRPWLFLPDPVLAQAARRLGPLLLRRQGEGIQLAAPFSKKKEFPMAALFCLGRVEEVGGAPHIVFQFDEKGAPVLPHSPRKAGQSRNEPL